ncbi:universal stress protein [Nakamurella antarctica]|nr:universal stress protein [Nakamurella antarctica]
MDEKSRTGVSPGGIPLPPDLRPGPVVVGVDAAATSGRHLRAAVFLARSLGRPVLLIHVRRRIMPLVEGFVPLQEDMDVTDAAEKEMEAALSADLVAGGDLAGVEWELLSTFGEAATEIIRIADERDAACVVVGKRHAGFAELLHRIASGSVSRAVVASQKFPVMVVP